MRGIVLAAGIGLVLVAGGCTVDSRPRRPVPSASGPAIPQAGTCMRWGTVVDCEEEHDGQVIHVGLVDASQPDAIAAAHADCDGRVNALLGTPWWLQRAVVDIGLPSSHERSRGAGWYRGDLTTGGVTDLFEAPCDGPSNMRLAGFLRAPESVAYPSVLRADAPELRKNLAEACRRVLPANTSGMVWARPLVDSPDDWKAGNRGVRCYSALLGR